MFLKKNVCVVRRTAVSADQPPFTDRDDLNDFQFRTVGLKSDVKRGRYGRRNKLQSIWQCMRIRLFLERANQRANMKSHLLLARQNTPRQTREKCFYFSHNNLTENRERGRVPNPAIQAPILCSVQSLSFIVLAGLFWLYRILARGREKFIDIPDESLWTTAAAMTHSAARLTKSKTPWHETPTDFAFIEGISRNLWWGIPLKNFFFFLSF